MENKKYYIVIDGLTEEIVAKFNNYKKALVYTIKRNAEIGTVYFLEEVSEQKLLKKLKEQVDKYK